MLIGSVTFTTSPPWAILLRRARTACGWRHSKEVRKLIFFFFFLVKYFTSVAFSVDLLTAVVDTDYYNWAVFVQCSQDGGENRLVPQRKPLQKRLMTTLEPNLFFWLSCPLGLLRFCLHGWSFTWNWPLSWPTTALGSCLKGWRHMKLALTWSILL